MLPLHLHLHLHLLLQILFQFLSCMWQLLLRCDMIPIRVIGTQLGELAESSEEVEQWSSGAVKQCLGRRSSRVRPTYSLSHSLTHSFTPSLLHSLTAPLLRSSTTHPLTPSFTTPLHHSLHQYPLGGVIQQVWLQRKEVGVSE